MNKIAKEKRFGSVKRFGARYGRTVKNRLAKIEAELRKKHKCPYCHAIKAKRVSVGIWECGKCNSKFTGKAFSVEKRTVMKEKPEEIEEDIIIEDTQEEKEKGQKYSEKKVEEKYVQEELEEEKPVKKRKGE